MIKVCVIGMGHIGSLHARIYKEDELCELAAVCDINEARARAASSALGVPFYLDAQTMLDEVRPQLVSVTTGGYEYSSDHCKPTLQALSAGCDVLCEKPISNRIECGEAMVAKAKEMGVRFAIDMNHRFTPAARAAKKWQDDGLIGDLLFCNMKLWIGKFGDFESPYYHLKALNPHSVDIMRYFCGDVEAVQCFAMKAPGRNIYSTASINMRFKNGAVGHLTSSYDIARSHAVESCEVAGVNGRLVFEDMWKKATLYPADSSIQQVYQDPVFGGFSNFDDTFRDRIRSFVRQCAAGVSPDEVDGSGASGLAAQKVIHAAIDSLETGKVVYL